MEFRADFFRVARETSTGRFWHLAMLGQFGGCFVGRARFIVFGLKFSTCVPLFVLTFVGLKKHNFVAGIYFDTHE